MRDRSRLGPAGSTILSAPTGPGHRGAAGASPRSFRGVAIFLTPWPHLDDRLLPPPRRGGEGGGPPERLLVYEVGSGWEPLCKFLGVPVPAGPHPSENSRAEFISASRPRRATPPVSPPTSRPAKPSTEAAGPPLATPAGRYDTSKNKHFVCLTPCPSAIEFFGLSGGL